jgi:hypothetical protein
MNLRGGQCRTNAVKDSNGDLLVDSHSILNMWNDYFCQLLNAHGVTDIRQVKLKLLLRS